MGVLMRCRDVSGRPVVTLDGADDVAEVKDVVIDGAEGVVVGLTLNGRGLFSGPLHEVLPWSRVGALGPDAVMVDGRDALGEPDPAMDGAVADPGGDVIGARVITDGGKALGEVVDVVIEVGERAEVVGFEMVGPDAERDAPTLLIPADRAIAVSGDALIVPAATEQFVRDDMSSFDGAVADFRRRGEEGAS
jgi:uncharacterized protein YrrD